MLEGCTNQAFVKNNQQFLIKKPYFFYLSKKSETCSDFKRTIGIIKKPENAMFSGFLKLQIN